MGQLRLIASIPCSFEIFGSSQAWALLLLATPHCSETTHLLTSHTLTLPLHRPSLSPKFHASNNVLHILTRLGQNTRVSSTFSGWKITSGRQKKRVISEPGSDRVFWEASGSNPFYQTCCPGVVGWRTKNVRTCWEGGQNDATLMWREDEE